MLHTFLSALLLLPSIDDKPLDPANPVGRFARFEGGAGTAVHVWHDESGWHMRFRGQMGTVRYQGKVVLDTEVPQLRGGQREKNDKIGRVTNGIAFDFKTKDRGFDSIDFTVPQAATRVTFDIKTLGNDDPKRIFIGSKGVHPKTSVFTLPAHPAKK
jgi:hypothetical protein